MTLRKQFPDFFRLAKDLRAMRFDFDAPPPRRKVRAVQQNNADGSIIYKQEFVKDENGTIYEEAPEQILADDIPVEEANLLTSRHRFGRGRSNGKGMHRVVLDIDMDAALIPSTTPGHHHLIIDKTLPWDQYEILLNALAEAGIIQRGYAKASIAKGYTAIRPPWVKKNPPAVRKRALQGEKVATWMTKMPSPKPATSSKPDGAKEPYTKTPTDTPSKTDSTPTEKPAAYSEPSTW